MSETLHGVPGHDKGKANVGRGNVVNCPACGDDLPQATRGPHADRESATAALELHLGMITPRTRGLSG